MHNKFSPIILAVFFSLAFSSFVNADNLGQFDARSMALGGTGVASANSANAAAHNPALMATESGRKNFSIILPGISVRAFDENSFIDSVEDAEESVNGDGGLNDLLDGMNNIAKEAGCDPVGNPTAICFQHPNMQPTATKSAELEDRVIDLNNSNLLLNANAGLAIQFGKRIPMAVIADAGFYGRVGIKAAESDFDELGAYTEKMADGSLTGQDFLDLNSQGLVGDDTNNLEFTRSTDDRELGSMLEVIGATYAEVGLSFADAFVYGGRELSVGITPKIVSVEAIKYHQSVEEEDVETDDIFEDENIVSKTDFNADVGLTFKPLDTQPMLVGFTIKNLFTRSYELKKTQRELELEQQAAGSGSAAANAKKDLAAFNFTQQLAIEPQLTAGIAYDLKLLKFMADLDLNEAEVLGRTSQHLALGTEFDARFFRLQLGYRTAIGGDDEDDVLSAGTSIGPLAIAAAFSGDQYGVVLQTGFSF